MTWNFNMDEAPKDGLPFSIFNNSHRIKNGADLVCIFKGNFATQILPKKSRSGWKLSRMHGWHFLHTPALLTPNPFNQIPQFSNITRNYVAG